MVHDSAHTMPGIRTYPLLSTDDSDWLHMRVALWPEGSAREHVKEMAGFLTEPDRFAQFVVRDDTAPGGGPCTGAGGGALGQRQRVRRTGFRCIAEQPHQPDGAQGTGF